MELHHRSHTEHEDGSRTVLLDISTDAAARVSPLGERARAAASFFLSPDSSSHALVFVYIFVLCYGASFTLTLTMLQAFAVAGLPAVRRGVRELRETLESRGAVAGGMSLSLVDAVDPTKLHDIARGIYAGGLAALTCLRSEGAAAIAIGADGGARAAASLEVC